MTGLTQVSTHLMCHYYANHVKSMNLFSSVRGENEDLFLRSNSVCFCLSYSMWNHSIQGFQGLEERVWNIDEATERKTKKYFVEITERAR